VLRARSSCVATPPHGSGRRLAPSGADGACHSPDKTAQLRALGADAVVLDALDAKAVHQTVAGIEPEAIVHQATALADVRFGRNLDRTSGLRRPAAAGGRVRRSLRTQVNPSLGVRCLRWRRRLPSRSSSQRGALIGLRAAMGWGGDSNANDALDHPQRYSSGSVRIVLRAGWAQESVRVASP
jgi:hypothetical protein